MYRECWEDNRLVVEEVYRAPHNGSMSLAHSFREGGGSPDLYLQAESLPDLIISRFPQKQISKQTKQTQTNKQLTKTNKLRNKNKTKQQK